MSTSWTIDELHAELADYYSRYKGSKAPETAYVLSLWHAIEVATAYDEAE